MYCLLCAYIVSTVLENTEEFSDNHRLYAGLFGLLVSVALAFTVSASDKNALILAVVLCLTSLTLLAFRNNAKAARTALCVCTVLGVGVNVFLMYYGSSSNKNATVGYDYAGSFHDKGAVFETLFSENTPETVISSLPDAEKTRYDIFGNGRYNVAMQRGVNSTEFYYSVSNPYVSGYFDALHLNVPMEQKYSDSDGRLALDMLAGCRYFVSVDGARQPFGYSTFVASTVSGGRTYDIYENPDSPGLVYAFDKEFSSSRFNSLTPAQKQQIMLSSAVTDASENTQPPAFDEVEKKFDVVCGDGAEYDGKSFRVTKKNAEVTLTFNGDALSETYLDFEQIGFSPFERSDLVDDSTWAEMTDKQKEKANRKYNIGTTKNKLYI